MYEGRASRLKKLLPAQLVKLQSPDAHLLLLLFRRYFRRFRIRFALTFIMIAIVSLSTAAIALLVKEFVNEIFVDRSGFLFVPLFGIVLLVFSSKGLATYYQSILGARISNEIVADVRQRLFSHVIHQRMEFFSKYSSDELQIRFSKGAEAFGTILNVVLINGARDAGTVLALVVVMVTQDLVLTAAVLVVFPFVFYCVTLLLKRIKGLASAEMAGVAELYQRVRETVQGIIIVKSYNLEQPVLEATNEGIDSVRNRADRIAKLQMATIPLMDVMGGISVGLAVLYAGFRTHYGEYDAGTFMSFLTALLLVGDPSRRLSQMRVNLKTSFESISLVTETLDSNLAEDLILEPKAFEKTDLIVRDLHMPPSIDFDNVTFGYSEQSVILKNCNLHVESGSMVALVGPSGAGKSTILKLLLKFHEPKSGEIRFSGTNITAMSNRALREQLAYVSQSNFLFDGTVADNLRLLNESLSESDLIQVCQDVGLHHFIAALPKAYDTNVGELGALISGGQAQRLNFARALLKNAPVLLLDEVTSALDAENENRIRDIILGMKHKKTVIVVAHRLSTILDADQIALVRDGNVIDMGSHDELLERSSYYARIVSLQFPE
jgi:subfamily B ATP-binding cassette protein MsbA